jgi:MFS family permease
LPAFDEGRISDVVHIQKEVSNYQDTTHSARVKESREILVVPPRRKSRLSQTVVLDLPSLFSATHVPCAMTVRYSKNPAVDRALRHSTRDAAAYSVMSGGAETYLSAFALYLRATAPQIALLATLPPLLGAFSQFLSAWLARLAGRRTPVIVAGAGLQAFVWLPMLVLPLWFPQQGITILLICVTVYQAMGNVISPLWTSVMGDLVPERKRGRFFGRRTRVATITAFVALVLAGVVLHLSKLAGYTFAGFTAVFVCGAIGRLVSAYHLARVGEPPQTTELPEPAITASWLQRLRHSHALRFSVYIVCLQGSVAVAGPFFAVYMLRDLHFSYLQFMANTGTAVLMQFFTLNTWGRISDVFGNRLILVATGALIPLLPLLWLVSDDFWYLIGLQVMSGFVWAGFSLSSGNFLYDLVPSVKRTTYMTYHNVFTALGVFVGGMIGAGLTHWMPAGISLFGHPHKGGSVFPGLFAASGLLRLLVAGVFLPRLEEVRKVRRTMSARELVFRVTRFNAFMGLLYEVVTMFHRERDLEQEVPAEDARACEFDAPAGPRRGTRLAD